jgi:hypothetical protein
LRIHDRDRAVTADGSGDLIVNGTSALVSGASKASAWVGFSDRPSSELSTCGLIGCGTLRPIAALHKSRQLPGLVLTGSPSRHDSQAIFRVLIGSHLSGAE